MSEQSEQTTLLLRFSLSTSGTGASERIYQPGEFNDGTWAP
jgi:hypothetical protein